MAWSKQQEGAIKSVIEWLKDSDGKQIFRLFGFAGSGKTTLAKEMASTVIGKVLYACFTGKAALVLISKGCAGAQTIHSLIYKAVEDPWTGKITFELNLDSPLSTAELLIIDEVSMVGEDLAKDLLKFGKKILVLGDPAQLPPVKGEGYFINAEPDVMLTEVHRQAADNPIIRMSMDVRDGLALKPGSYGDSQVIQRADIDRDAMRELVLGADQLLCGLNKTRQSFNARVREINKIESGLPVIGDRLVCLRNNREKGLLNGSLWTVKKHQNITTLNLSLMDVESIDNSKQAVVGVETPNEFFQGREKELDWKKLRKSDQFTYGYCLTVHKSQGSQWPNVLLFDESRVFREDAAKHLYTGITRAADKVTVVV